MWGREQISLFGRHLGYLSLKPLGQGQCLFQSEGIIGPNRDRVLTIVRKSNFIH
jgi:hypothetical protein